MGTLFVVGTPIGNLEDITSRALATLKAVTLIAAEDTRHSRRLLDRYGITTPLVSYHQHNERGRREQLLDALDTGDIALISDAGTPAISDPGADLVRAALAAGHRVAPIPGPSSLAAAVSAAGLVDGPFVFLGFLPRERGARRRIVARAAATTLPLVVFESPNRLAATLAELLESLGDRDAVLQRELTKIHEEVRAGTLSSLQADVEATARRGEVVLVIEGTAEQPAADSDARDIVAGMRRAGLTASQAAKEAAGITGMPRSELYALAREYRGKSVGLECEFALADEHALENTLRDEERPDRGDS